MPVVVRVPERLISRKDVERLTSLKKSSIYSLIASGEFPSSVSITPRRRAWVEGEVQAWIGARMETRPTAAMTVGGRSANA